MVFDFDRAIVREPAPTVIRGLRSGAEAPSYEGVLAEFRAYVAALEAGGVAVEMLEPLGEFPDSVFVEDPAFVLSEGAILLKPGAPSRMAEAEAIAPALRRRFERAPEVAAGFDEGVGRGGHILILPDEILIGLSARTDRLGARRFCELAAELGRPVRIVETPAGTLHLKTACALIDEATVIATPALAGMFAGYAGIETPAGEERAANLLRINDAILIGADYPKTIDLLVSRAPNLIPLAVAEIRKIDAGLSCLSLRWRD